jgi:hypothetical protein
MNQRAQEPKTPGEQEVAAVMAAIAAYLDTPPHTLKLKAIKQTGASPRSLWSLASRQAQHARRCAHARRRGRA